MTNLILLIHVVSVFFAYSPFMVEGDSMEPNLHSNQVFLIDKLQFKQDGLERGDVIVFSFDQEYFYVKRIIGLPGESVLLEDSEVKIKDETGKYQALEESYLPKEFSYGAERFFKVPENHYFVLGDNRSGSKDSRSFKDPYIDQNVIFGKYVYP